MRAIHIGAGFLALVFFWLPLLVKKGGRLHVVFGRAFVGCAAVVSATSLAACAWCLVDPIGFLGPENRPPAELAADSARRVRMFAAFLGSVAVFYTLVPLVLAVAAVRTRLNPERLAGTGIGLLLWFEVGIGVALIVYASTQLILYPEAALSAIVFVVGVFGLGGAWRHLRFVAKPRSSPMLWWYKHMEFMITTGIGLHTAFLVVGLKPWLGALGTGPLAMVPWVLPSVVGVPAIWYWVRHYRRKFGAMSPAALARVENANLP